MKLVRTAYTDLVVDENGELDTDMVAGLFAHAAERKLAFVAGTVSEGSQDAVASELSRLGRDAGYRVFLQPQGSHEFGDDVVVWSAVRGDLSENGWEKLKSFYPSDGGSLVEATFKVDSAAHQ